MFFYFSQVKAKSKRFVFAALVFVLLTAFLGGCNNEPEDGDIYGKWNGQYGDSYIIGETDFEYVSDYGFGYSGTIKQATVFSDDSSGVFIIEYTEPPTYMGYNGNDFTAVYYRNLTSKSVQIANVINILNYNCVDTETEEEAINAFTFENIDDYVSWDLVDPYTR